MGKDSVPRGFKALPIRLSEDSDLLHHFYYKKHVQKADKNDDGDEEEDTSNRTLFAVNIPFSYDYNDVSQVFSCFGDVESVIFHSTSKCTTTPGQLTSHRAAASAAKQARVIFLEEEAVERALHTSVTAPQPHHVGSCETGMEKWMKFYNTIRPESETLQFQVDKFMEAFDMRTKQEKAELAAGPVVDADGWTVVRTNNPKKKRKLPSMKEDVVMSKKKKKTSEKVVHFYRHQQRQEKREQLAELRRKFEEDKLKLAKMKESRQFNPF